MAEHRDSRAEPSRPPAAPLLAAGAGFAGLLHVHGGVWIDGEVEGEIVASETVWIGASGRIRARVEAREVVVAGDLAGDIHAGARIELRDGAHVKGDLHAPRLLLAEGAFLEGRCHTGGAAAAPDSAAAISPPRIP